MMKNHDYVAKRNALIPDAEKYAYDLCGPRPKSDDVNSELWAGKWNSAFHKKMDSLAKADGLVR